MTGAAGGSGRPEFIVTIDEETLRHGRHRSSRVDCGRGVHLPIESLQAMAGRARFVPVVVDRHGVVIRQGRPVPTLDQLRKSLLHPVSLDHGRTRRYASRISDGRSGRCTDRVGSPAATDMWPTASRTTSSAGKTAVRPIWPCCSRSANTITTGSTPSHGRSSSPPTGRWSCDATGG